MAQLHKRFTDSQVKELMGRYLKKEIKRTYLQEILGVKRRRLRHLRGVRQFSLSPGGHLGGVFKFANNILRYQLETS